ncbi:MAG: D-alanyl-D-alanine dipeptidase, partial [Mesorhizobium sp.]
PSHPPLSCRTSPPQGGRSAASALRSLLRRWRLAEAVERVISLLAGEMSGRTEGGAVPPPSKG